MKSQKPNFFIIGSAKCGTTTLASILAQHPDCCMSNPKEVYFFQDTSNYKPNPNYSKGWAWYQRAFAHYNGEKQIGEACPGYADRTNSPETAKRIFEFNPRSKIIFMVRDPLARQISAWKMQYFEKVHGLFPEIEGTAWALEGFETWMRKQCKVKQWDQCRYGYQLDAYRNCFPDSQMLVSFLEDWKENSRDEICRIFSFLNLSLQYPNEVTCENSAASRLTPIKSRQRMFRAITKTKLTNLVPAKMRDLAKTRLFFREHITPSPKISNALRKQFIDYISRDICNPPHLLGRGQYLWPSMKGQ